MRLLPLFLASVLAQTFSTTVESNGNWVGRITDTRQDGCKWQNDFFDDPAGETLCGFWFPKVQIPHGAKILSAKLTINLAKFYPATVQAALESAADSTELHDYTDLSCRKLTKNTGAIMLDVGKYDIDLTRAVADVVAMDSWAWGNAMLAVLFNGTSSKGYSPIFSLFPDFETLLTVNYDMLSSVARSSPGGSLAPLQGDWGTGFSINSLSQKLTVGISNVTVSSTWDVLPLFLTGTGFLTNDNVSTFPCALPLGGVDYLSGSNGQFVCDLPCAPGQGYMLTFSYCWAVDKFQYIDDLFLTHRVNTPRCFNETFNVVFNFPDPVLVNGTLLPNDGRPFATGGGLLTSNATTQSLNDRLLFIATVGVQHLCLRNPSPWMSITLGTRGSFTLNCTQDFKTVVQPPNPAAPDYRTLVCTVPACNQTTCPGGIPAFLYIKYGNFSMTTADSLTYPTLPVIVRVSGCVDESSTSTAECPTSGGVRMDITMAQDLGFSGVAVLVGGAPCTAVYVASFHIQCNLPPGIGTAQPVLVFSGGYTSAPVYYLSYGKPLITELTGGLGCVVDNSTVTDGFTRISVSMCDRNGSASELMTVTGANFGVDIPLTVTLQDVAIEAVRDDAQPHSILYFALPPGLGSNVLKVTVGGQSATATVAYEPCPLGQDARCIPCPAGSFGVQPTPMTRACELCPPGYYQPAAGTSACLACPYGEYQPAIGQLSCNVCPEKMTSLGLGSFSSEGCSACPVTHYVGTLGNSSDRVCLPCAPNSLPNEDSCGCRSGYFDDRTIIVHGDGGSLNCRPCPAGANCQETGTQLATMGPLAGWWRSPAGTFVQCLDSSSCLAVQWGHYSPNASTCLTHRSGVLCAECEAGYQPSNLRGGACIPCDSSAQDWLWVSLVIVLLVIGLLGVGFYFYRRKQAQKRREERRATNSSLSTSVERPSVPRSLRNEMDVVPSKIRRKKDSSSAISTCKIVVGFLQILSSMVAVNVSLPSTFMQIMRVFSFLNFDFMPWASIRCVFNISFYTRIYIGCLYPFAIVLLLLVCVALPIALSNKRDYQDEETFREVRSQFVDQTLTLALFCVFLLYPWVTLQLLQFGICMHIDGKFYLLADMGELCLEGQWLDNLGPVIALFLLLSVGIPVTLGALLYRSRKALRTQRVRQRLGFLYLAYSADSWWFELVEMSTRVALISIVRFFDPLLHAPLRMGVCLAYLVVVLLNMPYVHESLDSLSLFCMTELMLISSLAHVLPVIGEWQGTYVDDLLSTVLLIFSIILFLYALLQLVRASRWLAYHPVVRKLLKKSLPSNRLKVSRQFSQAMFDSEVLADSETTIDSEFEAEKSEISEAKPSKPKRPEPAPL